MTAIDMARRQYIPAVIEYATFLSDSVASLKSVSLSAPVQEDLLKQVGASLASVYKNLTRLEGATARARKISDTVKQAEAYRDKVFPTIQALRADIDALELLVPADLWPVPTYVDLLFNL